MIGDVDGDFLVKEPQARADPGLTSAGGTNGRSAESGGRDPWRRIVRELRDAGDATELLECGCRLLVEELGFTRAIAATVEEDGTRLVGRAAFDPTDILPVTRALTSLYRAPIEQRQDGKWPASAWCVVGDEQIYVPDVTQYAYRPELTYTRPFFVKAFGVRELLLTPIRGSDRVLGLLGSDKKDQDGSIGPRERRDAQTLGTLLGAFLEEQREREDGGFDRGKAGASDAAPGVARRNDAHRQLMQRVLEAMREGLLLIDPAGQVRFLNEVLASLLGVFPWDVVGSPWSEVLSVAPRDAFEELLEDPPESPPPHLRRWRLDLPGGGDARVGLTVLRLEGASYRDWRAVLVEDVSNDVSVERMREEFIAMLVHDLKAPAQSVVGFAELLRMERVGELNDAQHEFVRRVEIGGKTMMKLVDDILDVERFEAGRSLLDREPMEIGPVVDEVVDRLELRAREESVTLSVELPADLPSVYGDRLRLVQVVQNLVDNAIRASEAGGSVRVSGEVTDRDGHEMVRVTVADEGEGLDQETARRMFDKLWSGRNGGEGGQLGFGLVIARLIVEGHGGEIQASGAPGEGATVTFTVPAYDPRR